MTRKPLFAGASEKDQLDKIFKIRGTPTTEDWPDMTDLPLYEELPQYETQDLSELVPDLPEDGLELLEMMLQSNPANRVSAAVALKHPFLEDAIDIEEQ